MTVNYMRAHLHDAETALGKAKKALSKTCNQQPDEDDYAIVAIIAFGEKVLEAFKETAKKPD